MHKTKNVLMILLVLFIGTIIVNMEITPNSVVEAATKIQSPSIWGDGWEGVYGEFIIKADKGCTIYYTIDGTEPNKKSSLYIAPFMLETGKKYIIKAVAYQGKQKSQVASKIYNEKLSQLGTKVKSIIRDNIKSDMTDFEKVMTILVYFEDNIRYDINSPYCSSAEGALVYNRAICSGYCSGFGLLMKMLGVPCKCVSGYADWYGSYEGHAWNMVKLDGKWYMLEPQGHSVLLSDEEFKKEGYTWDEEGYPKCSQSYFLPANINLTEYLMEILNNLTFSHIRLDNVEKIVVKKGVKSIGDYTFENCKKLKTVEISNTVEEIGEGAFINCTSLTSVTIPDTVKMIKNEAFKNTPWLENQTSEFIIVGDGILIGDNLTDYSYVVIPDGVKVISGAFAYTDTMEAVSIPNSVTKIVNCAFDNSAISSVVIPDSVTEIGRNVFRSCQFLSEVQLSSNLKILGERAFCGCHDLEKIELPDGLESIGVLAFDNCYSLSDVVIPNSVIDFSTCFNETPWKTNYPDDFIIVGDFILLYYKGTDNIITIPEGVKSISSGAFRDITTMKKVTLPTSIIRICDYAFCMQPSLESISIPDGVTYIGNYAFFETNLKKITIPGNVKSIGSYAFASCSNLKSVVVKNGVESIGDYAFEGTALTEITLPKSVRRIGKFVFPIKENKEDLIVYCSKKSIVYDYAKLYGATIVCD